MNDKLKLYAELKQQEKMIAEQINVLKKEVFDIVFNAENEQIESEFGKFEIRKGRENWKYSDELLKKEKDLKEAIKIKQKEEQLKGVAILEAAPAVLVFTPAKD